MNKVLLAEWEHQEAIIIAWPHKDTDWKNNLLKVEQTYIKIVEEIADHQKVIILSRGKKMMNKFALKVQKNIKIILANYNDTWTRDYIGLSVKNNETICLTDFKFNGWGKKHPYQKDNSINLQLFEKGLFKRVNFNYNHFVLEGGSIDSDGLGTILTTKKCLLNKNRNSNLNKFQIENTLSNSLGVQNIIWLENGYINGDDTDSHVDTLARFCNEKTIVYSIDDSEELKLLEKELKKIAEKNNYSLIPVKLPKPIFNKNKQLPATYVNFLITNRKVLVPTYNDKNDLNAISTLKKAFPKRDVIGINCKEIIKQNGSLHCITMQVAKNVLNVSLL
tara:strand:+ start:603 stop:1604 length:1002 start_codon:yes stop_codon:yes gene_type:complete